MPLGQLHSDADDLAEYLGFLGMAQDSNWNGRERMRLQNDFFAAHAAPAAGWPSRVSTN